MIVDYIAIINAAYSMIKSNDLFNPEIEIDNRLINQLLKTGKVPGPPFPAITIGLDSTGENFRTLGYMPWIVINLKVSVWTSLPSDKTTARLKTDLGLSNVNDDWESYQECLYIQSKLEEWIRGDETDAGKSRRTLWADTVSGINIKIVQRHNTKFNTIRNEGFTLNQADSLMAFNFARIT